MLIVYFTFLLCNKLSLCLVIQLFFLHCCFILVKLDLLTWYQSDFYSISSKLFIISHRSLTFCEAFLCSFMANSSNLYSNVLTGVNNTIDVFHPYYLSSSDNPGMSLTTIVLDEHNYSK